MTDPLLPTTNFFAIIVAGGSGSRMKSDVPKQFLILNGKPILQHTIEQFLAVQLPPRSVSSQIGNTPAPRSVSSQTENTLLAPENAPRPVSSQTESSPALQPPTVHIILVLPERDLPVWDKLCEAHNFHPPIQTVIGGNSRFQSVRNGLQAIDAADGLVAVHDGVRPFVTPAIIQNSFETAARVGSAVTCVPVKDSVRVVGADGTSQAVDRAQYRLVQTPQTFRLGLFRQAFQSEEQAFFTDCASVVEFAGFPITLIDGAYENIKITTPDDLK